MAVNRSYSRARCSIGTLSWSPSLTRPSTARPAGHLRKTSVFFGRSDSDSQIHSSINSLESHPAQVFRQQFGRTDDRGNQWACGRVQLL